MSILSTFILLFFGYSPRFLGVLVVAALGSGRIFDFRRLGGLRFKGCGFGVLVGFELCF